jgi:hypothetical protein
VSSVQPHISCLLPGGGGGGEGYQYFVLFYFVYIVIQSRGLDMTFGRPHNRDSVSAVRQCFPNYLAA